MYSYDMILSQVQSCVWSPWDELRSVQTGPAGTRGRTTAEAIEHAQTGYHGNWCGGEEG